MSGTPQHTKQPSIVVLPMTLLSVGLSVLESLVRVDGAGIKDGGVGWGRIPVGLFFLLEVGESV